MCPITRLVEYARNLLFPPREADILNGLPRVESREWQYRPRRARKNTFQPYAFVLDAGEYALSGFDLKLAHSLTSILHYKGDPALLIKDGKAMAAGVGD